MSPVDLISTLTLLITIFCVQGSDIEHSSERFTEALHNYHQFLSIFFNHICHLLHQLELF